MNKAALSKFHARLQQWYAEHGRHDLPWRTTRDAYEIYVSEIMLQQTQVETVRTRFYPQFLQRFPTLSALAQAPRADILKAWEGLGYYRRAGHLHEAAMRAAPSLPANVDALIALPGIGRNTAHAVAAFAFNIPVPVMEANVKRVLHRIFALEVASDKKLWELAGELMDHEQPFNYNQAMMDIGSAICTPRAPKCSICPANVICQGQTEPERYPAKKLKKAVPVRQKTILLIREHGGKLYAPARPGPFLAGLRHFVELEPDVTAIMVGNREYDLAKLPAPGAVSQQYSHFTLQAEVRLLALTANQQGKDWLSPEQLQQAAMSGAERKILALPALQKLLKA